MAGNYSKDEILEKIASILKDDGSFTDEIPEQRAREIMSQLPETGRVEFSPTRYGVVHTEQDKTLIAVYKKGHNFYTDKMIEEVDISSPAIGEQTDDLS